MSDLTVEEKVSKLEHNFIVFNEEIKTMNKTLNKIEIAIEKQNEIQSDIKLLRSEVSKDIKTGFDKLREAELRINKIESNESKIVWGILSALGTALLGLILR